MFVINFLNSYFMCTIDRLQTADCSAASLSPSLHAALPRSGLGKLLLLFQTHLPTLLLLLLLLHSFIPMISDLCQQQNDASETGVNGKMSVELKMFIALGQLLE